MKKININIKKLHEDAVIPVFAHDTDSGFDFFTCEDTTIEAGEKAIIPTGLAFELPYPWGIQVKNKSGITVKGCPIYPITIQIGDPSTLILRQETIDKADITVFEGTIDMAYRGEVGIMIKNEESFEITIPKHTKIAQGVLRKVYQCNFNLVDEFTTSTDRGENGFGSTGNKL